MSLVNQLDNKNSPIRRWFNERTDNRALRQFSKQINDQLADDGVLIQPKHNQHSTAGMAFDYLFRWQFGGLENANALKGARYLEYEFAPEVAKALLQKGNATDDLIVKIRCAVTLSWFEVVYRSLVKIPNALIEIFAQAQNTDSIDEIANAFLDSVDDELVNDLSILVASIKPVWGDDLQLCFVLNPEFAGSVDIHADADWVMGDTLFECKTTKAERPFNRKILFQSLGYVFLDYDDTYDIQKLGWYYPRHKKRIIYNLHNVLKTIDFTENLASLRLSFRDTLRQNKP